MPRKTTQEEIKDYLKEYKPFLAEIDFISYKVPVCVLAADFWTATEKLKAIYPGCEVRVLSQLAQVIPA